MKKIIPLFLFFIMLSLSAYSQNEFITVWKTDNPGTTASNAIQIPIAFGYPSNFNVDWGDGNTQSGLTGTVSHTYATAGTYTVKMTGTISGIQFAYIISSDREKLLEIKQWGTNQWRAFGAAFQGCTNLNITATDAPDLSQVTSLQRAFANCPNITNPNLNGWNVSTITSMKEMFAYDTAFNGSLNLWNTANVADMSDMFYNNSAFNQPIGSWNVGSVTNFSNMFRGATSFNNNLNSWNVSNGRNFSSMFSIATAFNQPLNNWNMINATDISYMFDSATSFSNSNNITGWNVSNVTNMRRAFNSLTTFNQNLSSWNVSSVTDMEGMFSYTAFNQNISGWNVSNVTNMSAMFQGTPFNQNIGGWNVGNVTDMGAMFFLNTAFNQNIGSWDVSKVTRFWQMFYGATAFNQNLGSWNVIALTDAAQMFYNAGLSTTNYDALLVGWSARTLKPNVNFHAGNSVYCSVAAQSGRNTMTNTPNSWTITDGGPCAILNVDNKELDSLVAVYPNPASDFLNIELPETIQKAEIAMYSLTGQLVLNSNPELVNNSARLSLNKVSAGIYLMKIITDNGVLTKRLIIK